MRSRNVLRVLTSFAMLIAPAVADAWEFSCGATACVIPRNGDGVPHGIEVCYDKEDKKEKIKEVTWKNGVREGLARCFEKGKLKTEMTFEKNVPHGFIIKKKADSRGDLYVRYEHGQQLGFQFYVGDQDQITEVWRCFKDEKLDDSAEDLCLKADYGAFQKKMKVVFDERFRAEQERNRLANGPQERKYPDGKLKAKFTMKSGVIIGEYVGYHPNGKIERKETYDDKGRLDGLSNVFDEEGRKKYESIYESGQLANQIEYYQNGKTRRTEVFTKQGAGIVICTTSHWDNGEKQTYGCHWNNSWSRADGAVKAWAQNGQLIQDGFFKDGQNFGVWRYFDETGKARSEVHYKEGCAEKAVDYDVNGRKTETTYFPDGSVKGVVHGPTI